MTIRFRLNPRQEEARRAFAAPGVRFCLMPGGSRSGKTWFAVRTIAKRAAIAPGSRHLVLRKHASDCKATVAEKTLRDVLGMEMPEWAGQFSDLYGKQRGEFTTPNGSLIRFSGLDDAGWEKILGDEYDTIYMNEASEQPHARFEQLRTRLANNTAIAEPLRLVYGSDMLHQKFLLDLNPTTTAHWTYRVWIDGVDPITEQPIPGWAEQYRHVFMNPEDNRANLTAAYLADLDALSPAMRRRFREGRYSADAEGALWRRAIIHRVQVTAAECSRIVISVDPAAQSEPGHDETGIIACGHNATLDRGYVLADDSGRLAPVDWARRALALWRDLDADCIVAEQNQGGEMVEAVIRSQEADFRAPGRLPPVIRRVTATKGKAVRAEPIAGLYERGKVFHAGEFSQLEDQLCAFTVGFDRKAMGYSPDRLDALVWGMTALFGDMTAAKAAPPPPRPTVPQRRRSTAWMGA